MRGTRIPDRRLVAWALLLAVAPCGCTHAQRPEHRVYVISEDAAGVGGSGTRDCDAEHVECFDKCWNSTPPLSSIKKGSGKHHEYCTEECRKAYMDCFEEEHSRHDTERTALRFSSIDGALDWLRDHKSEVAIGTVVIVAGVTFMVATGGAGALVLAPLAL
jgi:hypothetical protein